MPHQVGALRVCKVMRMEHTLASSGIPVVWITSIEHASLLLELDWVKEVILKPRDNIRERSNSPMMPKERPPASSSYDYSSARIVERRQHLYNPAVRPVDKSTGRDLHEPELEPRCMYMYIYTYIAKNEKMESVQKKLSSYRSSDSFACFDAKINEGENNRRRMTER